MVNKEKVSQPTDRTSSGAMVGQDKDQHQVLTNQ